MEKLQRLLWVTYTVVVLIFIALNFPLMAADLSNIIISGGLLVIALLFYNHAWKRFQATDKIVDDLNHVTNRITEDYNNKNLILWDEYKKEENLFTEGILIEKYAEFKNENGRFNDSFRCDIENYINREVIDKSLDRNILNLISGTMTGLGILGTFAGLTIGLQGFDTGNAEAIMGSIGGLMDGIKVAFHTSIYGMVFSLVFGFVYRKKTKEAYNAVDRFLDVFSSYVIPDTNNANMQRLLAYEEKQAEGILDIADTFGDKVAQKLGDVMEPEFRRMNDTIEKFATVATESQVDGVERIVDKFIETMNKTLGTRLLELDAIMKETCEWQKRNIDEMSVVLSKMNGMAEEVVRIDELTNGIIEHMTNYMAKADEMQGLVNANIEKLEERNNAYAEVAEKQQQYISEMADYEKEISNAIENLKNMTSEQLEEFKKAREEMAEETRANMEMISRTASDANDSIAAASVKHVEEIGTTSARVTEAMDKAVGSITETSARQIEQIEQLSAKAAENMEKSLAEITDTSTKQIQHIGDESARVTESMEKAVGEITETSVKQIEQIEQLASTVSANTEKSIEKVSEMSDQHLMKVSETSNETVNDIKSAAIETTEALKKKFEEINTVTAAISDGLDKSTADITNAAKELNSASMLRLKDTFEVFDKSLADITRHLSGTITEVQNTTAQVPKVVSAAYDGMENSFNDMQKGLEEMTEAMLVLRRNMAAYRELLQDD